MGTNSRLTILAFAFLLTACLAIPAAAAERECAFSKSLHSTGAGMKLWYDQGIREMTGIPYEDIKCPDCPKDDVACVPCHVKSCERCHAVKDDKGQVSYSVSKAKKSELCLECHGREALTAKLDKEAGTVDVHTQAGMGCTDCHGAVDVHGDGKAYQSMKEPGAIKAACVDCHGASDAKAPAKAPYDATTRAHRVHGGRLECAACHVSSTVNCHSCHFDAAMKTGVKKGNFLPVKSWVLLVNYNGKVTSGGAQTLVWEGKPFVAYAPQFTHSVTANGRGCPDCHASQAVKAISSGKKVTVVGLSEGKAVGFKGVIPLVPESLEWTFAQKKDGSWTPVAAKQAKVQMAGYATPLSKDQMRRLCKTQK